MVLIAFNLVNYLNYLFRHIFSAFIGFKICASVCSNALISTNSDVRGDASEKAILSFLNEYDDPMSIRKRFPKVAEIPFNSINKYQVNYYLKTTLLYNKFRHS